MRDDEAIIISNLHKKFVYSRNRHDTFKSQFLAFLKLKSQPKLEKELYHGLNLTIRRGEVVAFLGVNGSGKSTLLKIISGIYSPDSGEVRVAGTLGTLIELGAGFHPEFTGRENINIYAQILGIRRQKIKELIPEITAFSELGEYVDQPVKLYSSGMYMRLAFSVAVAIDPDVLIVDEILSVGDFNFAQKCRQKMNEFKERRKTICLVSHDLETVKSWATRTVVLDGGRVAYDGEPLAGVRFYLQRCQVQAQDGGAIVVTAGRKADPEAPVGFAAFANSYSALMPYHLRGYPLRPRGAAAEGKPWAVLVAAACGDLMKGGYGRQKYLALTRWWRELFAAGQVAGIQVCLLHNSSHAEKFEDGLWNMMKASFPEAIASGALHRGLLRVDFCPVSAGKALPVGPADLVFAFDWSSLGHLQASRLLDNLHVAGGAQAGATVPAHFPRHFISLVSSVDIAEWPHGEAASWLNAALRDAPVHEVRIGNLLRPEHKVLTDFDQAGLKEVSQRFTLCLLSDAALDSSRVNISLRAVQLFLAKLKPREITQIRLIALGDPLVSSELAPGVEVKWLGGDDWAHLPLPGGAAVLGVSEHDHFKGVIDLARGHGVPVLGVAVNAGTRHVTEFALAEAVWDLWQKRSLPATGLLAFSATSGDIDGVEALPPDLIAR